MPLGDSGARSGCSWTGAARGRVPGSDSMGEDPGDHGGLGDHGDDPHQPLAPGTGERIERYQVTVYWPPRTMRVSDARMSPGESSSGQALRWLLSPTFSAKSS
jgi:hypothetical protein